jgi:uncharacterized membrane protein (DUF2068 family)
VTGAAARTPGALRAIIIYKLVRAVLSLLAGVACVVLMATGREAEVRTIAGHLNVHGASALSLWVSQLVLGALEPTHFLVVTAALFGDGLLVLLEAIALQRGWKWGRWLVVGASAALLPFELVALSQKLSVIRLGVLLGNAVIVWWLVRHQTAEGGR